MKDFTYQISGMDNEGNIIVANETNKAKGYKQSWFKTEESARKHLNQDIRWFKSQGYTNIKWSLFSRIHGIGIIETNA